MSGRVQDVGDIDGVRGDVWVLQTYIRAGFYATEMQNSFSKVQDVFVHRTTIDVMLPLMPRIVARLA